MEMKCDYVMHRQWVLILGRALNSNVYPGKLFSL